MSVDASTESGTPERERGPPTTAILAESVRRIVRDPLLALPFVVAGFVLTAVDWLRLRDPVPTTFARRVSDVTVSVSFPIYPSGVRTTGFEPAALVDLRPWYLLWTVGLELLAVLTVGLAGWLTLSWAAEASPSRDGLASYLGFVVAARLFLGTFGVFDGLAWVSLVAFVALVVAFVRLFAAPALVVGGDGLRAAVRRSSRLAHGRGATVFGLVLVVGLAAWLLGSVPVVGALVSSALVAPVHAVAVVTFVESVDPDRGDGA